MQAAKAIKISGATGRNAGLVNGLFELTTQTVNGAPVWKMSGAKPRCFPLSYSGSAGEDGHCTCAHAQLHVCAREHIVASMCMYMQAYLCARETAVPFFAFHHRFAPVSIAMIVEIAMWSCVR